jgi:hypothetical protein
MPPTGRFCGRSSWLKLDDFAVLQSGCLHLLLLPNRRLIRARCRVCCPCVEIPRQPFESFAVRRFLPDLVYHKKANQRGA